MLFLAMKLLTAPGQSEGDSTESSLYHVCKSFLATLEAHGVVSLRCLQAMILIALYEYSHAIYPAAWMTIGACSRYIDILGLSNPGQTSKTIRSCTTWTEIEERRRVWWAAFVIDRVISLGSRRRFSMPDPSDTDVLLVDDFVWDSGDVTQVVNYTVSAPFSVINSPFARLCYSAICVSRVAECRRGSQPTSSEKITAVVTLTENLYALSTSLEESLLQANSIDEYLDSLGPRCLTWSALFMLLDTYCCPEQLQDEPGYNLSGGGKTPEEQMLQVQASFIVRNISEQVHTTAMKLMEILETSPQDGAQPGRISTFCLDSFYCAMATFHWILCESGDASIRFSLEDVKRCMRQLGSRWRLASEYLALEEVYTRAAAT